MILEGGVTGMSLGHRAGGPHEWDCCLVSKLCLTLCDPMNCSNPRLPCSSQLPGVYSNSRQASLSITNSRSLLKLMSIESVMPSSHLICHPLLLLPPIPPSIRVFSNESALHMRWPKYWSFSLSISPSNEHPGLISFRMDWLNLLAVQAYTKLHINYHLNKVGV